MDLSNLLRMDFSIFILNMLGAADVLMLKLAGKSMSLAIDDKCSKPLDNDNKIIALTVASKFPGSFDIYIDVVGSNSLHVASRYGAYDIIEKILETAPTNENYDHIAISNIIENISKENIKKKLREHAERHHKKIILSNGHYNYYFLKNFHLTLEHIALAIENKLLTSFSCLVKLATMSQVQTIIEMSLNSDNGCDFLDIIYNSGVSLRGNYATDKLLSFYAKTDRAKYYRNISKRAASRCEIICDRTG